MKGYRISVIRHGMTEANEKGVYIGRTDVPLSPKGAAELAAKQAEAVAEEAAPAEEAAEEAPAEA